MIKDQFTQALALVPDLENQDFDIRQNAAAKIKELLQDFVPVFAALINMAQNDTDSSVRQCAREALEAAGIPKDMTAEELQTLFFGPMEKLKQN